MSKHTLSQLRASISDCAGSNSACAVSLEVQAEQSTALLLMRGVLDRTGALSSWDPATSYCTWRGITCDAASSVQQL